MKKLSRSFIKIENEHHLMAVLDFLDKMQYQRLYVPHDTKVIRILPSGEYTGTSFRPADDFKEIFLKDIISAWADRSKEFLNTETGEVSYFIGTPKGPQFVPVPEGADTVTKCKSHIIFWKEKDWSFDTKFDVEFTHSSDGSMALDYYLDYWKSLDPKIIWQRPTLPDDLPFIDDEPPAHFVVRPKPRQRVYATLRKPAREITVILPAPVINIDLNFTVSSDA